MIIVQDLMSRIETASLSCGWRTVESPHQRETPEGWRTEVLSVLHCLITQQRTVEVVGKGLK